MHPHTTPEIIRQEKPDNAVGFVYTRRIAVSRNQESADWCYQTTAALQIAWMQFEFATQKQHQQNSM